jgi:hypothetical protein
VKTRKDRFWWRFHLITGRPYDEVQWGFLTYSNKRTRLTVDVWTGHHLITLRFLNHD